MNHKNSRAIAPDDLPSIGPDRILGGLTYLRQCLSEDSPVAVVTARDGKAISVLMRRFLDTLGDFPVARIETPASDSHAFLEGILREFGFEPFDATVDDLRKLLTVYVQHEASADRRAIVVVERTDETGPPVLEMIQALTALENDAGPAILFVLAGSPELHRVLDSASMLAVSAMARRRFDLDLGESAGDAPREPAPDDPAVAELLVSLDGNLVGRYPLTGEQMLIGRNEHNDIAIVSRYVSRHHALIVNRAEGAYVVDLKSTNGTYINAHAVSQHALKDGDVIGIGNFQLRYVNPSLPRATGMSGEAPSSLNATSIEQAASSERWKLDRVEPALQEPAANRLTAVARGG